MGNWMNKMQEYDKRIGVPEFEGWEEREIKAYGNKEADKLVLSNVTHRCDFKKYGDVEKRCLKCGYIIPFDADINDSIVLENMIKSGYPIPDCSNGG